MIRLSESNHNARATISTADPNPTGCFLRNRSNSNANDLSNAHPTGPPGNRCCARSCSGSTVGRLPNRLGTDRTRKIGNGNTLKMCVENSTRNPARCILSVSESRVCRRKCPAHTSSADHRVWYAGTETYSRPPGTRTGVTHSLTGVECGVAIEIPLGSGAMHSLTGVECGVAIEIPLG